MMPFNGCVLLRNILYICDMCCVHILYMGACIALSVGFSRVFWIFKFIYLFFGKNKNNYFKNRLFCIENFQVYFLHSISGSFNVFCIIFSYVFRHCICSAIYEFEEVNIILYLYGCVYE